MCRDREKILREPVVDLARDARSFLGYRTTELGAADRAPDADEQHAVREQAQVVALRHVTGVHERREHEVQRREQHQRRAEREPVVEVLTLEPEAVAEADDREQEQHRLRGERAVQRSGHRAVERRVEVRQRDAERA